jgi:thioredoxin reductase
MEGALAKAEINSGICGFTATVETRMEGSKCLISIESDCDAIQRLGEEMTEVEPFQEITFRGEGPNTLKLGAKHCYHTACPVPVGIIKAIEVSAGLALPAEVSIKLLK